MQDLSRCRWVSTKPGETSRPPMSSISPSAASCGAIAAILPHAIPISVSCPGSDASRAFRRMKSMTAGPCLFDLHVGDLRDLGPARHLVGDERREILRRADVRLEADFRERRLHLLRAE